MREIRKEIYMKSMEFVLTFAPLLLLNTYMLTENAEKILNQRQKKYRRMDTFQNEDFCDLYSSSEITIRMIISRRIIVVGIATIYGLDDREDGVRVPVGSKIFSSPRCPYRLWGPANFLYSGYRGIFLRGVKRPGPEADHTPTAGANIKKMWIYTSTPP
jgi:hypothetical protein